MAPARFRRTAAASLVVPLLLAISFPRPLAAQSPWRWSALAPCPALSIKPSGALDPLRGVGVVAGGMFGVHTVEWDGQNWTSIVGSPSPITNFPIVFDGTAILAVAPTGTWRWNGRVWTMQNTPLTPPSSGLELVYDPARQRVVAFGGTRIFTQSDETWEWDGSAWTRMNPAARPPARHGHALAYHAPSQRVILFGGYTQALPPQPASDTWAWDGTSWTQMTPTVSPPARGEHTLTYVADAGRTVLHGGYDGTTTFADVWSWDGNDWQLETPSGTGNARSGHAAFVSVDRGSVIVYEGLSGGSSTPSYQTLDYGIRASYVAYRQSCPSSVGLPFLSATAPRVGRPWSIEVTGLRPHTAGYLVFALHDDRLGLLTLPIDLTFLGATGCFLNVNSAPTAGATLFLLPSDGLGVAALRNYWIPNTTAILGFTFFNQYVSLDAPRSRPLAITTTNAGRGVIGR